MLHICRRLTALCVLGIAAQVAANEAPPNIIVILADDMGAADWSRGGSQFIATPQLDALANDGVMLTDFHASASVCTPSRAGLLTGRYPARVGLAQGVIQPWSEYGIPKAEITIAEILRDAGYATAMIGKWHLGTVPEAHPLEHGFDHYLGVPYSNDMQPFPLLRDRTVIQADADQTQLTRVYTEAVTDFIARQTAQEKPFFVYLAHTFPHIPLFASESFKGQSKAGRYGDTIEEIDWSLGQIRAAVAAAGVTDNTLIVFTSDNGPWFQGDSGRRGRKGDGYDGAFRVPFIAALPGTLPANVVSSAMTMNIDLLPTLAALAGAELPDSRTIDGKNIVPVLQGGNISPHQSLAFFINNEIAAIRTERWRYVVRGYYMSFLVPFEQFGAAMLFDLDTHGQELYDVAEDQPDTVAMMHRELAALRTELEGLPQQVTPYPRPADKQDAP